ncbi:hypothetical protein EJ06DRAFT_147852 [Trichodelitschia bisporula]|uniref:Uncharacterized protein n=1 Tax=Trichodelitschia bisporula TaxID=703511 RepID=A0A6G1HNB7_9PEZI|nr:hypothetical protein EJ06DRAFT_147852 [Trichodelitschia bisporula]
MSRDIGVFRLWPIGPEEALFALQPASSGIVRPTTYRIKVSGRVPGRREYEMWLKVSVASMAKYDCLMVIVVRFPSAEASGQFDENLITKRVPGHRIERCITVVASGAGFEGKVQCLELVQFEQQQEHNIDRYVHQPQNLSTPRCSKTCSFTHTLLRRNVRNPWVTGNAEYSAGCASKCCSLYRIPLSILATIQPEVELMPCP